MNAERYFTVILNDGGIVDKLAYQLRILYSLGEACEYKYIHTPINFERSWKTFSLKAYIDKFERILFFKYGVSVPKGVEMAIDLVERAFKRINRFLDKKFNSKKYETFNKFLGLDSFDLFIHDKKFKEYKVVDVPLEGIFSESKISNITQLKEVIERFLGKTGRSICCFSSGRMYDLLSTIEKMLSKSNVDVYNYQYLNLSKRYWRFKDWPFLKLPFDRNKIMVVVHVRRGDSMSIDLGSKNVYLHGEVTSAEEFKKVLEVDAGREINICDYELVLQKIFQKFDEHEFSCIIISDGFDTTLTRISRAISKGRLILNLEEKRALRKFGTCASEQFACFSKYSNVSTIIGETNANILKSIHALACADIVIHGSIGFSYGIHQLFRRNNSSLTINVKNLNNGFLDGISEMVEYKKESQNY